MVVGFPGKAMTDEVKELIHTYHVGAIILFSRNIGTPEEVYHLTQALQNEAKAADYERPLLICLDQENGIVRRLGEGATLFPGAMALGATGLPELAYKVSKATGEELKALGINWNLAPVLDVNNNPRNPVIGVRSFGESPTEVAEFGQSAMKGMQDAGVMTALKHFPGHGDTHVDSHLALPMIEHDLERLEEIELKPFRTCIDKGADVVMAAHVHFPAIEPEKDRPATLSKYVLTDLLRGKLQFDGAITTDCMEMDAIANTIGTEQGAVEAFKAGSDFIMVSHTHERQIGAIKALVTAVEQGEIDEKSIDQSIQRINRLIDHYTSWDAYSEPDQPKSLEDVGSATHQGLAEVAYEQSVTVVRNNDVLPLDPKAEADILVLQPTEQLQTRAEDAHQNKALGDAIKQYYPKVHIQEVNQQPTSEEIEQLINQASGYDYVILGTLTITPDSSYVEFINVIQTKGVRVIGVGMRSPYDAEYLKEADAFLLTYEPAYPALEVAGKLMTGKIKPRGRLPVTLE